MAIAKDPANPELEAQIARDPDDDASWQVYADWLNEQGAVRGELAALQLAYEKKRLPSLRKKAEALLEAHPELFLGTWLAENLEDYAEGLKWKGGFWRRGVIRADDGPSIASSLGCRSAKLMQSLSTAIGEQDMSSIPAVLAKHGPFPALRRLTIGDIVEYGQSDVGSELERRTCKGLAALPSVLPELRSLFLQIFEHFDFASFPKLRTLKIAAAPIAPESLRAVLTADLPKLTSLELILGSGMDAEGASTPQNVFAADFASLAEGTHVPRLKKLAIHVAFGNAEEDPGTEARLVGELKQLFGRSPLGERLESRLIDEEIYL